VTAPQLQPRSIRGTASMCYFVGEMRAEILREEGEAPSRVTSGGILPVRNPGKPGNWESLTKCRAGFMLFCWRFMQPGKGFRDCPIRPLSHLSVRRLCRSSGGMCGDGFSEFDWASLPWGREIFNWFSFHAWYRYHSAW